MQLGSLRAELQLPLQEQGGWEIKLQTNPRGPPSAEPHTYPEHLYTQNCVPPPKLTHTHTHMQDWKLGGHSHASGTLRQDIPYS